MIVFTQIYYRRDQPNTIQVLLSSPTCDGEILLYLLFRNEDHLTRHGPQFLHIRIFYFCCFTTNWTDVAMNIT